MRVLDYIPFGHENAVSREYLVEKYMNHYKMKRVSADRKLRFDIATETQKGNIIIHSRDGYFRYKNESDLPYMKSYYRSETSRGWDIVNKNRVIQKFLSAHEHGEQIEDMQIGLFDTGGD